MFAQRTRTRNTDEAKRKYFLVYEGKETEEIYFESVSQNRSKIGIDPLIERFRLYVATVKKDGAIQRK